MSGFSIYLVIGPSEWLVDWFELEVPRDVYFRYTLLAYGLANFLVSMLVEYFVIDYLVFRKLRTKMHNVDKSHRKFLLYERDMSSNSEWPLLSREPLPEAAPDILFRKDHPCQVCRSKRTLTINASLIFILCEQLTEIQTEKRVIAADSEYSSAAASCRGSPPSLPPNYLSQQQSQQPFNQKQRFGGSACNSEVPLDPRSLFDDASGAERRNTVSMQTMPSYYDETMPTTQGNCISRQVIDYNEQQQQQDVATLPRHDTAAAHHTRAGIRSKNMTTIGRRDSSANYHSALELDVLPFS